MTRTTTELPFNTAVDKALARTAAEFNKYEHAIVWAALGHGARDAMAKAVHDSGEQDWLIVTKKEMWPLWRELLLPCNLRLLHFTNEESVRKHGVTATPTFMGMLHLPRNVIIEFPSNGAKTHCALRLLAGKSKRVWVRIRQPSDLDMWASTGYHAFNHYLEM